MSINETDSYLTSCPGMFEEFSNYPHWSCKWRTRLGTSFKFELVQESISNTCIYNPTYSCRDNFSTNIQFGSLSYVSPTQVCINKKIISSKCIKCKADHTNLELLSVYFQDTLPIGVARGSAGPAMAWPLFSWLYINPMELYNWAGPVIYL